MSKKFEICAIWLPGLNTQGHLFELAFVLVKINYNEGRQVRRLGQLIMSDGYLRLPIVMQRTAPPPDHRYIG